MCEKCSAVFAIDIKKVENIRCLKCGSAECTLKTGMEYYVEDNLEDTIDKLDVLYVTRVQKERFPVRTGP